MKTSRKQWDPEGGHKNYYLCGSSSFLSQKPLQCVGKDDILFIIGHSSFRGGQLSLKKEEEGCWLNIRVDLLADLLKNEGLNHFHRCIKLNSCYGGGSDAIDRSLAKDLALQLGKRGFNNIMVGGYQFVLTVNGNFRITIATPVKIESQQGKGSYSFDKVEVDLVTPFAKEKNSTSQGQKLYNEDPYRCWYDGNGLECFWNVPDEFFGKREEKEKTEWYGITTEKTRTFLPILHQDDQRFGAYSAKTDKIIEWINTIDKKK